MGPDQAPSHPHRHASGHTSRSRSPLSRHPVRRQPHRSARDRSPSPRQPPPPPASPPAARDRRFRIAVSSIVPGNSSWGLFATTRLVAGSHLGIYGGERLTDAQLRRRYNVNDAGQAQIPIRYVLDADLGDEFMYTDGRDPDIANDFRYINHVIRRSPLCNCEFTEGGAVTVRAGHTIEPGDELGISYGAAHTAAHWQRLDEQDQQRRAALAAAPPPVHERHRTHAVLWNAAALTPDKWLAMQEYLSDHRPLAAIITETHRSAAAPPLWARNYFIHNALSPRATGGAGDITVLVRTDIAGSTLVPAFGINFAGAPAAATAALPPGSTSQWLAVKIHIKELPHPLVVVAAYIQPATHAVTVPLLRAQLADLERSEPDAMTILAGDLNYSDPRTGSTTTLPPASEGLNSDILTAMADLDYECASAELAHGQRTHRDGGVLDLFLERAHPAADHIIHAIDVDNGARTTSGLIGSDHFPVRAELTIAWPLAAPAATPRLVWDTNTADDAIWADYACLLSNICANTCSPARTPEQRRAAATLGDLLHLVDSFTISPADDEASFRRRAQPIADATLEALEGAIRRAALDCIGQRPKLPYQRKGYTPELRQLRKQSHHAERRARQAHPAQLHDAIAAATEARVAYRQALAAVHAAQWDELRAAITQDPDAADPDPEWAIRNKLVWAKVRQHQRISTRTPPLVSGLRKPDGSLTADAQDTVDQIAEHYRQQLAPHPITDGSAYRDPAVLPDLAALRQHLADMPARGRTHLQILAGNLEELVTAAAIGKLLSGTPPHTAPGPDGLTGPLLRRASTVPSFCDALAHLINFCHAFHIWPRGWRDDNKLPLLKRGSDSTTCKAYRPIALTNILARMIERLVRPRYMALLEPHLSRWQLGFRKRRSTQQCIMFLMQRVHAAVARAAPGRSSTPYPVAFLDIVSAFDSVPHELLLLKLYCIGVRGRLLQFVRAFLTDRRFRVVTHAATSDWTPATAGTPQGAVLSVLFFLLYINDMLPPNEDAATAPGAAFITRAGTLLYADDGTVAPGTTAPSITERTRQLQTRLDEIGKWADVWGVRFSATKSGCVWFRAPLARGRTAADQRALGAPGRLPTFTIPCPGDASLDVAIPNVTQYKYLGVWLHQALSPVAQVEHLMQSAAAASNLVRGMLSHRSPPGPAVVRQLCLSLIQPRVTYSLPFVNASPAQLNRLTGFLLRPMLSVTSVPATVHRFGACTYFGMLPFAVQKDLALVRLASSCLEAMHDPAADAPINPDTLPVASAIRRRLHPEPDPGGVPAFAHRAAKARRHPYSDAHHAIRQELRFPHGQMLRAIVDWRLTSFLPPRHRDTHAIPPDWDGAPLRASALRAAGLQANALWLLETTGTPLASSPLHHFRIRGGRPVNLRAAALRPRGALLPPLLGVNPAGYPPRAAEELPRRPLPHRPVHAPAAQRPAHQLGLHIQPSLLADPADIARARTRLALNRANFAGIRAARAPIEQQLCTYCHANAIDDARHVLTQCTHFEAERRRLRDRLHAAMLRVRQRLYSPLPIYNHLRPYRFLASLRPNHDRDNALLHLFCIAPAPLLHILERKWFARALRHTGQFIRHICSVRQV